MSSPTTAAGWCAFTLGAYLVLMSWAGRGETAGHSIGALVDGLATATAAAFDYLAPDPLEVSSPNPPLGEGNAPTLEAGPPPVSEGGCTSCVQVADPDGSYAYPHLRREG